ncbi:MAG: PAS domain-containing protein [Rhodospirillaceae bacterium]|jgi:hypothetical protein|nr:PAS domain-containing protein [Rhodospirillaceae bacterium]MBT4488259.1 PAS domain-containing protein [Rhodospirillaceae bacterium]MBT5192005.1 PAS domain-containing protein [Rhodospirillaceae bacterium]MBT5897016.1 PAS domain-containing protein [Rhodospirillaceae bacterium]MBT6426024.1 PAS domain-containing protein [Rhodospirillaceae bacterium]
MPFNDEKYLGTGLPHLQPIEIAAPELPFARALLQLYEGKRKGGELPFWREFELAELVRHGLAQYIYVLEPVDGNLDWRYRLLGTEIVARFRIDRTGQKLRDFVEAAAAEQLVQISNQVATSGVSKFFRLVPEKPELGHLQIETMSLPIRDNSGKEIWLFGGTFFQN